MQRWLLPLKPVPPYIPRSRRVYYNIYRSADRLPMSVREFFSYRVFVTEMESCDYHDWPRARRRCRLRSDAGFLCLWKTSQPPPSLSCVCHSCGEQTRRTQMAKKMREKKVEIIEINNMYHTRVPDNLWRRRTIKSSVVGFCRLGSFQVLLYYTTTTLLGSRIISGTITILDLGLFQKKKKYWGTYSFPGFNRLVIWSILNRYYVTLIIIKLHEF